MTKSDLEARLARLENELAAAKKREQDHLDGIAKLKAELRQTIASSRHTADKSYHLDRLIMNAKHFALYRLAVLSDQHVSGRVIFVSPSFADIAGSSNPLDQNSWWEVVHPDDLDFMLKRQELALTTGRFEGEFRIFHPVKNEWRWLHALSVADFETDGSTRFFDGFIEDITDRKRAELALDATNKQLAELVKQRTAELERTLEDLEAEVAERQASERQAREALAEKEVLLREIHHRVKNNLQNITSLMDLQTHYAQSEQVLDAFQDCRDRVRAMCMVHQQLYQADDLASIALQPYLDNLLNRLSSVHGGKDSGVHISLDIGDIHLDLDRAIACGLILNELIANSLKYAFPGQKDGLISIAVRQQEDGKIELEYSDDGIGLPLDFDPLASKSLGLRLVKMMSEGQLDGSLVRLPKPGTAFRIVFDGTGLAEEDASTLC